MGAQRATDAVGGERKRGGGREGGGGEEDEGEYEKEEEKDDSAEVNHKTTHRVSGIINLYMYESINIQMIHKYKNKQSLIQAHQFCYRSWALVASSRAKARRILGRSLQAQCQ